jgi:sulfofructosephosphate aldolase
MEDLDVVERETVSAIARPNGVFALVACDQQDTLRVLLARAGKGSTDEDMCRFKVSVARCLSAGASGLLVDPIFGLEPVTREHAIAPGCGLVLTVDRLVQEPGGPVVDTNLDESLMTAAAVERGVRAFKCMVIWRPGVGSGPHLIELERFIAGCRRLGVASVLEGLVPADGLSGEALTEAIVSAAVDLGRYGADIYKGQVPYLGDAPSSEVIAASRTIALALNGPWVVLSGGISASRFPEALQAACEGGARGFLAGRGIWAPSIEAQDMEEDLATHARSRLDHLVKIADQYCGGGRSARS